MDALLLGFFWAMIALVRLGQGIQLRELLPLYLAIQAGLVAILFVKRRKPHRKANRWQEGVAWLSALLPLSLQLRGGQYHPLGEWVAAVGVAISILAVNRLDKSFGVAPADRGLVDQGIYRLVRHPMYLGELLALWGAAFSWLTVWNVLVVVAQMAFTVLRIRWEERLIAGYESYKAQVKWRLLPLIW
ncbi:MAG: methyltransferase [Anaerolineales bacterium]